MQSTSSSPSAGTVGAPAPELAVGAAFVDGAIVPVAEARIPLLDTGFLKSDLTYDVVAVWNGSFFRLDDHLDRFERGCRRLRLISPLGREEIRNVLMALVARSGLNDAFVEFICTRGIDERSLRDPRRLEQRFYALAIPYVWLLPRDEHEIGMDAIIAKTVERISSRSVDPTVKNFHWGDFTRGLFEAYDREARYVVLLDAADNVTEGAGYNLFAVLEGRLRTPDTGALEGITRRTVLELAAEADIPTVVGPLSEREFRAADELFATSTAGGVMPITRLDGRPVGDGAVGPLTRRLRDAYWEAHSDPRFLTTVEYAA